MKGRKAMPTFGASARRFLCGSRRDKEAAALAALVLLAAQQPTIAATRGSPWRLAQAASSPQPAAAPPSQQPAAAPPSQQPAAAAPSQQPAAAPPSRQPAAAAPSQQPAAAPPSQQPAAAPAPQPAAAPPSQQPAAAPPSQQPAAAPPSRQPAAAAPTQQPAAPPSQQPAAAPPSQQPAAAPAPQPAAAPPSQQTEEKTSVPATVVDVEQLESVLGIEALSSTGEDMGRIVDIIVDRTGQVRAAIIDFGGFLGVGSRKIAVDWRSLHFDPKKAGVVAVNLTKDQLRVAPVYKAAEPVVMIGGPGAKP
jgi:hypothetical protein